MLSSRRCQVKLPFDAFLPLERNDNLSPFFFCDYMMTWSFLSLSVALVLSSAWIHVNLTFRNHSSICLCPSYLSCYNQSLASSAERIYLAFHFFQEFQKLFKRVWPNLSPKRISLVAWNSWTKCTESLPKGRSDAEWGLEEGQHTQTHIGDTDMPWWYLT